MWNFDWDAPLPDAERDELIEALAQKVDKRGLHTPAILLLEMHKPIAFIAGQSLVLGSGFLGPLFGPKNVQKYSKLLEDRANIERLVQRIEELQTKKEKTENRKQKTEEDASR